MAVNEGDDLASLEAKTVNDGAIVELLRRRYNHNKIYTYVSDVLLSVNPFQHLPIYGPKVIKAYQDSQPNRQLSPHVYSKCKAILRSMHHSSKSQCCVLTGNSASGKTESLKHLLDYVVSVVSPTSTSLKAKFSKVQLILEAFGNAVTAQNRNSSRFAMFYEVYFSPEMKLSGGKVHHYMLEKSRVVHQEKGAKNFHVFHYLLYGLDVDEQQEYHLSSEYPHRYLSYDPTVPPVDETSKKILSEKYVELLKSMESVGFTKEEILNVSKCLVAILHIGNVAFGSKTQTNSAFVKDPQPVKCASSLLGVSEDDLGEALIKGITYQKGEKISIQKPVGLANEGRDNLAKMLYGRLFGWLVLKVNSCLKDKDNELRHYTGPSLGLLDIFGFEKCEVNGLQQLCINTANEQLAHFYNQRVFAWEQEELESEGLKTQKISYYDNKKVVDLLLNPPQGLLPILEDESKTDLSTDAAFVKKCSSAHRKHSNYGMIKSPYPSFTIRHYTAAVAYVALGFMNSNKEMLGASLLHCMQGSSNEFVSRLFRATISGTGSLSVHQERSAVPEILMQMKKNKKNPTLRHKAAVVQHLTGTESRQAERGFHTTGSQLRASIAELMKKVLSCEVHFIRCIKPNSYQSPDRFDPDTVLAQVRALAVVQTIQMRNFGFPVWFPFDVFIKRFGILAGLPLGAFVKDSNQTCQKMLRQLAGSQGWRMGKTKVFLKYWCLERLYTLLDRFDSVAVVIQKVVRGWQARALSSRLKRLKGVQENNVKSFLNTIGGRSETMFQHNTNQVKEEDSKQIHKQNEMANVNRQAWSPNLLNQKSPSASSQTSSFDFPDAGSPPTSPRPNPPQQRMSDLSLGSVSDIFGPDSPTSPGRPQSRTSNLSVGSVSDVFSPDSPTRPGPPQSRASNLSVGSASDLFGPDSPTRPGPPQSRASNLSVGSASDLFGPDSPTRPGPPKSRWSDLSILSIGSTFSNESETEFDAAPLVWCKITCYEREIPLSEFSIDRPSIIIDGSKNAFDVTRIGLGALPPSSDPNITRLRNYVGKGIEIVNDEQGNVWVTRGSKNHIFVKGHFLSEEVIASTGVLEKDVTLKVFDWESFAALVQYHCLEPKNFDSDFEERILSSTSVYFSFVKDGEDDVNTPCWAQLDVLSAFNQAKAACKYARERKLQEKQKKQNALPPILRPKTKKSRELAAVAHFQEQIRPRRFVDTEKLNRKAWARTEVVMNPFLYGKKENLTIMKVLQKETNGESRKSLDTASPKSPSAVFGNNNDMTDGDPEQITVVIDKVGDVGEMLSQETHTTTIQKPGREKPGKKVWAKKKHAEDKADKAKKKSSSKFR